MGVIAKTPLGRHTSIISEKLYRVCIFIYLFILFLVFFEGCQKMEFCLFENSSLTSLENYFRLNLTEFNS